MLQRHTIHFAGHVQGVGFRFAVRTIAARFAVTGFVRNLDDGRVQLVLEGEAREIEKCLAEIRLKMQGYVHDVEQMITQATGEFMQFEIRR
jgi:acylphosphatase